MTLHDCGRATLLALAMLLAGCNQKQMYLPLPPAEVRIAQLILLIALSAKNAILIVGFARDLHLKDGLPLTDATIEAARLRLRPIVMTSLAFILGLLPPTHRKSIGPATLTGMMGSPLHAVVPDHMLTRDLAPGNIDNPLRAAAASARSTA